MSLAQHEQSKVDAGREHERREDRGRDEGTGAVRDEAKDEAKQPDSATLVQAGEAAARRMGKEHANEPTRIEEMPGFAKLMQLARNADEKKPAAAPVEPRKDGDDKKDAAAPKPEEMTGIGSQIAVGRFVGEAKKVQADWGTLKPAERAGRLGKAANDELAVANVPGTDPRLEDISDAGRLNFRQWALRLGKPVFQAATVDDAQAADIADTVYHESRHAEQWHRMARIETSRGKKPEDVARAMEIPPRIAADAATKPIDPASKEGKEADAFHASVYGAGAEHRGQVLRALGTKGQALTDKQRAYDALTRDASATQAAKDTALAAWKTAGTEYEAAVAAYMALPEEADAWKVGGAVTAKYLSK